MNTKPEAGTPPIADDDDSVTPSTRLLNQMIGPSPAPRMLTEEEIELLRRSKQEIAERVARRFRKGDFPRKR